MKKGLCFFSIVFISLFPVYLQAAANVTVTPQRVVLEGNLRSQKLTLLNTGDKVGEFRVNVEPVYINEAGRYEKIINPNQEQLKTTRLFRVSPRKVLLKPGESQIVRVNSRKPSDLAKGEYMAALTIKPTDIEDKNQDTSTKRAPTQSTVSVEMQVSVTLPLILRQGELDANISISEVAFAKDTNGQPALSVQLKRDGGRSINAYMEAHVEKNRNRQRIGKTWFVMYPPQAEATGLIPINLPQQFDANGSNLIISVTERQAGIHDGKVLGRAIFALE